MTEAKENMVSEIVQTTVRMPRALHKALADEIHRRKFTPQKTSVDKVVQESVALWLQEAAGVDLASADSNETQDPLAAALADVLWPDDVKEIGVDLVREFIAFLVTPSAADRKALREIIINYLRNPAKNQQRRRKP